MSQKCHGWPLGAGLDPAHCAGCADRDRLASQLATQHRDCDSVRADLNTALAEVERLNSYVNGNEDLRATEASLQEAPTLLGRWRQFGNERWHDHATTRLAQDTIAFQARTTPKDGEASPVTTQTGPTCAWPACDCMTPADCERRREAQPSEGTPTTTKGGTTKP